jgi:hypothetical protein
MVSVRMFRVAMWAVFLGAASFLGPDLLPGIGQARAQSAPGLRPGAGEVSFTSGSVRAVVDGVQRSLAVGDPVYEGDLLETGATGHLHVKTADRGFLALRPASRARIVLYRFDPSSPASTRIRLELESGVLRAVSGEGAQAARQGFRLNTPVAAVGIRGTDFSVSTTDTLTRAVVRSGAIVIAGFGRDCQAESLGPCTGDAARQLSAEQVGKLLELRRGQREPLLIDIRPGGGAPEQVAPPSPTEPRTSLPAERAVPVGSQATAVMSEATIGMVLNNTRPRESQPDTAPVAPSSLPAPAPAPERPAAVANWGRWQSVPAAAPGIDITDFVKQNGQLLALNRMYALAGSGFDQLQLPLTGEFRFVLESFEAFLTNSAGSVPVPVALQQGALSVDFGRARFTTSLDVTAQSVSYQLRSQGKLLADGTLAGNISYTDGLTNTAVQGALSGVKGERAAYVFEYGIDPRRQIVGGVGWRR